MKKLLLFALGAMVSTASFAQEEDVTHYIQNAGFDQDLTWQADGSKKEIVSTKNLSDRSIAGIAADGTLYATVNPSTPKKRSDGRTFDATNGFVGMMQGWEWVNVDDASKPNPRIESKACEWVYFGSLPYNLGETAIPVADDGTGYVVVASKPTEFDGGDGALYLRAGWTNAFAYKQVVKLPCAKYRLEYWTINANPNSTVNSTDLTQITCRKDVFKEEDGAALSATEWTKHEFEFTPTAEFTIQFGVKSGNDNSNKVAWMFVDGIKLYKIGEANRVELLSSDLNDAAATCLELAPSAAAEGFNGLASIIDDYSMEIEDLVSEDADQMEEDLKTVNAQIERFRLALDEMSKVNAVLAKMDNLLQTTNYAGKAALEAAYKKILDYKEGNIAEDADIVALLLGAVAEGNEAIKAYYLSQIDSATEQNPADFTFFIQNPWFINSTMEPVVEEGIAVYNDGDLVSENLTSTGWYVAGTTTGGDQNTKIVQCRTAWNAWATSIDRVAIAQDLTGLPNGFYSVEADLITQEAYANQSQVVFGLSTTDKVVSDPLPSGNWDSSDNATGTGEWTSLKSAKVIVVDGKLTIGAEGYGLGATDQSGWFCATNFKLNFLGKASDADIAAAVKASFDAKVVEAKDLADKMMLKGDQKALNDSIAKYETAADKDAYLVSIDALNAAIAEAQKSEAKYYDYLPTQDVLDEHPEYYDSKTLLFVKRLIDGEVVEGKDPLTADTKAIAQFAYDYVQGWLKSDTATYTKFDATCELLKNYVNTYIPAYNQAAELAAAAKDTGKTMLTQLMAGQKAVLVSAMQTKETVDQFVADLKEVMAVVEKQNTYEDADATDYTVYITNPNAEAITGWEIVIGNGDGNGQKSGQWMDDSGVRYFDSWHTQTVTDAETGAETHIGLVGFKFSQLIENLPNGTYTVGAYTRTPAEGAYIFAGTTDQDTTFVEIPLDYYEVINEETGLTEQIVAGDKYGPIWEAAKYHVEDIGDYTNEEYAIFNANSAQGRGWKHQEISNIVVTNHEMFIGSQCGTAESKTEKVFAGDWYSVGGWTLTLTAKGDNEGWNGPVTAIETVKGESKQLDGIYTITGMKAQKLQRGLNIIVRNGSVRKVLVK